MSPAAHRLMERSARTRGAGRLLACTVVLAALTLAGAEPASAQRADFLFDRPALTLSVVGGWAMAGESSQVFQEVRRELTVEPGDFDTPFFMVEAGVRLTERLDLAVGVEHAGSSVRSEMREWVTLDDQPIPQTTQFDRTRLMVSLKGYLLRRGRQVSQYAWVPRAWSPYVGAGVGNTWYEFLQTGDFVNPATADIFEARVRSAGSGPMAQAMAGVDVTLGPSWLLRWEYRHVWGSAELDPFAYENFDDIDLSGGRTTLGIAIRI